MIVNPNDKFLLHDYNGQDYYITIFGIDPLKPEIMKYSGKLEDADGRNVYKKYGNKFYCGDWLLEKCEKV